MFSYFLYFKKYVSCLCFNYHNYLNFELYIESAHLLAPGGLEAITFVTSITTRSSSFFNKNRSHRTSYIYLYILYSFNRLGICLLHSYRTIPAEHTNPADTFKILPEILETREYP